VTVFKKAYSPCGGVTKKASVIGLSSAVQCYSFVVANSAAAMQSSALPFFLSRGAFDVRSF
jgi:hypothetical protein